VNLRLDAFMATTVGVDSVMVRYPREGHGFREPRHVIDATDRSIKWYEKYFR
jgi:dipeptidyl aminopeptidase/acylaminoacyl peptidase